MNLSHKTLSACLITIFIHSIGLGQISTGGQTTRTNPIITAVPFLNINGNPRSAGMGEIGVVSSPVYYDADLSQNPALFARNRSTVGFQLNYTPWLRNLGIQDIHLFNLGGHISFDKKHVLTYQSRVFSLGEVSNTNTTGQESITNPQEHAHGLGYSFSINEHFSMGTRLNYIYSNLPFNGINGRPVHSIAGDLGFLYHHSYTLDDQTRWVWSTGLSLRNMGPKISYTSNSNNRGFIPTSFEWGTMLGIHNFFNGEDEFVLEGAYQLSKLMVPSAGVFSDQGAIAGMISSWGDANEVGKQESQEFIHHMGLEARIQQGHTLMAAVRGGLFLEHQLSGGRRYATFGLSLAAAGLRADFSYLRSFQQNHPLQNTLRLGLTFLIDDKQEDFGLIKL